VSDRDCTSCKHWKPEARRTPPRCVGCLNASGYAPDTKSFKYLPFYEPKETPLTIRFQYNPVTKQCDCDVCIDGRAERARDAADIAAAPALLELDPAHEWGEPQVKPRWPRGTVDNGDGSVTVPVQIAGEKKGMRVYTDAAVLPTDPAARKNIPIATGVIDYFPAALAEIAKLSKAGNDQHNKGEPLHWARGKSNDHADTIMRHFLERGTVDGDGMRHSAKLAWRALALLQMELEGEGAPVARGAR
jgi:hypothetical protein